MTRPAEQATVRAVAVGQVIRFEHPYHTDRWVVGKVDYGHLVPGGAKFLIHGLWWFVPDGHDIDVLHPLEVRP